MSSSTEHSPGGLSWEEVDRGVSDLAHALGAEQSPREALFNAELDRLGREHPEWGIPTEDEALTWGDHRGDLR